MVLTGWGRVETGAGALDEAGQWLDEAMAQALSIGDRPMIAEVAEARAGLRLAAGRADEAARLLGLAAALRGANDEGNPLVRRTADGVREYDGVYAQARATDPEAALAALTPGAGTARPRSARRPG
jgi:hypothetical protein